MTVYFCKVHQVGLPLLPLFSPCWSLCALLCWFFFVSPTSKGWSQCWSLFSSPYTLYLRDLIQPCGFEYHLEASTLERISATWTSVLHSVAVCPAPTWHLPVNVLTGFWKPVCPKQNSGLSLLLPQMCPSVFSLYRKSSVTLRSETSKSSLNLFLLNPYYGFRI